MNPKHITRAVRLLAVWSLAACAGDPAASNAPLLPATPYAAEVGALTVTTPLARATALPQDLSVAATIGASGGSITIPEADFTLYVPPGAVRRPTNFVVTALAGSAVAYEFLPHGTVFGRPLVAQQRLSGTSAPPGVALHSGYFPTRALVAADASSALIAELIAGTTDAQRGTFSWRIAHFSGYIVAW